jgi:hypothetical protein
MKRTRWLQETKQMRFKEAYDGWPPNYVFKKLFLRVLSVSAVELHLRIIK